MTKTMTFLVTGSSGLFAPYVISAAEKLGHKVVSTSRKSNGLHCDLTNLHSTQNLISATKPDVVINCAAITDVDYCELNPKLANAVNVGIVKNIVGSISPSTRLLQVSTDQVYSGEYDCNSEDKVGPINVYGKTKLHGEFEAAKCDRSLIARVNFFGSSRVVGRQSFSDWIIHKLKREEKINAFCDAFFSPLRMQTLANNLFCALQKELFGTYNFGSNAGMSKGEFIIEIAKEIGADIRNIHLIERNTIVSQATRPKDLRLDVSAIEASLGVKMPNLSDEIRMLFCDT